MSAEAIAGLATGAAMCVLWVLGVVNNRTSEAKRRYLRSMQEKHWKEYQMAKRKENSFYDPQPSWVVARQLKEEINIRETVLRAQKVRDEMQVRRAAILRDHEAIRRSFLAAEQGEPPRTLSQEVARRNPGAIIMAPDDAEDIRNGYGEVVLAYLGTNFTETELDVFGLPHIKAETLRPNTQIG